MKILKKELEGVFEIILEPIIDQRGYFMRVYDNNKFKEKGINFEWVQENHSRSEKKGVIRGLHFQFPPFAETKLIRCIKGSIFDVFVDLRKNSPTFGQWDSVILSEENKKMILIPRGFAHGFCTLTDGCEVIYKVDNYFAPDYEGGIIWNDSSLKIDWPCENPTLSDKDKKNLTFAEFVNKYGGIEL